MITDSPPTSPTGMSDLVGQIADMNMAGKVLLGSFTNWGGYSDINQGTLRTSSGEIEVAIKTLRIRQSAASSTPEEEHLRMRFYREVQLWRTLQHENIVPLLGFVMLPDGLPTLISPWYSNESLAQYLKTHPNPPRHSLVLDVVD
ncbi:hypothetical protein FRC02_006792, partial [Tulasnella sp. 418]